MGGNVKGFKILDDVPIFFFANGLMIKGFPFYPYYSKQAQVSCCPKLAKLNQQSYTLTAGGECKF